MAVRVEINDGMDKGRTLQLTIGAIEIQKACPFIKEVVVSNAGLRIKICDGQGGDYTAEFQQVLRVCREHITDFRFGFLPDGLFIKFPSDGEPSESDEESDDDKKFKLIVKSPELDRHHFFEINPHTTTVLMVKDMIMRPALLDPDYDEAKGEEDILAVASTLKMFNKGLTKELGNFSTIAEHFPRNAFGGEVVVKFNSDFDKNSELAKALMSGSFFRKLMRLTSTDFDKQVIHRVPPSELKGTMEINVCENVKVFYQFGIQDKIENVFEAIGENISDQLDFSADGNFRLKYCSSASFLMSYQPIWAELGENPVAEVVISLKGGGKHISLVKKQGKVKELKGRVVEQAKQTAPVAKTDLMKQVDGIIETCGNQIEVDAVSALKGHIESNSLENLEKLLSDLNASKAGGTETKIRSISALFYGDLMKELVDEYEAREKIINKGKLVLEWGFAKSELGLSKIKALVREAIIFKRGQTASSAMET